MEFSKISLTFCLIGIALFPHMSARDSHLVVKDISIISGGTSDISLSPVSAPESSTDSQDSPQAVLHVHNSARAKVGVQPLTWDDVVAAYARNKAKESTSDCSVTLSTPSGPYGVNYESKSFNLGGADAVRLWLSEKAYYNLTSNICAPGQSCDHYAQVISDNSTRLGCAKVRCDNDGTLVVCNYDPRGNLPGHRPINGNQPPTRAFPPSAPPLSPHRPINGNQPSTRAFPPSAPPLSPPKRKKEMKGLMVGLIVGPCALIFVLGFAWFISRRKRQKGNKFDDHATDVFFGGELRDQIAPKKFSLVQIAKVTSNFKCEMLGKGGFGAVYKGYLRNSDVYVAVKRISKASKQGIKAYAAEVNIISRLRHKNLIKLIGWCHEKGELILVYEFMENGSLDSHIFKYKSLLTWEVRYKIVRGLASALSYLHEEGDHCVLLHRDIKTSNIMLDSNFNTKLGDFGLARLVDHAKGTQTTGLAGTLGYMAPECVSSGKVSKETDVYSFGIVALEIACGRRSIEPEYEEFQASLVAWVWDSYGKQRLLDVADPKLCLAYDAKQMECLLMVGLWCVHPDPNQRPSIRQAIQALNFETALPRLPGTRPTPTYDVLIAFGNKASEPCLHTLTITVPR